MCVRRVASSSKVLIEHVIFHSGQRDVIARYADMNQFFLVENQIVSENFTHLGAPSLARLPDFAMNSFILLINNEYK